MHKVFRLKPTYSLHTHFVPFRRRGKDIKAKCNKLLMIKTSNFMNTNTLYIGIHILGGQRNL